MVNMEWTPRLQKAFKKLQSNCQDLKKAKDETEARSTLLEVNSILATADEPPKYVDMDLIKRVSRLLLEYGNINTSDGDDNSTYDSSEDWIHEMIRGSSVYVAQAPPKERSPELERIMEGIKAQLAEKEYQRMISSITPGFNDNTLASGIKNEMKEMKEVKAHMIGIINVLYTGAAVFTAIYMISGHFTEDMGLRVLLALVGFVFIIACEAYLYSRHISTSTDTPKKKNQKLLPEDVIITKSTFLNEKEKSA